VRAGSRSVAHAQRTAGERPASRTSIAPSPSSRQHYTQAGPGALAGCRRLSRSCGQARAGPQAAPPGSAAAPAAAAPAAGPAAACASAPRGTPQGPGRPGWPARQALPAAQPARRPRRALGQALGPALGRREPGRWARAAAAPGGSPRRAADERPPAPQLATVRSRRPRGAPGPAAARC